ncbi:hypothetical protein I6F07_19765 [Ensifer sp. IC4062]|nr:hypothetical protein [Ensifer sp. IC4062]MCA1442411.1 hypothetical protein [Ensifer sp. IC4062]
MKTMIESLCVNSFRATGLRRGDFGRSPIQHLLSAPESWFPEDMKGVGSAAGTE